MKRRLIKQGMGGITVSLPIKWIRQRQLKPGDEIDIVEAQNSLVLEGSGESTKKRQLELDESHPALIRTIIAAHYRQGYSELTLRFKHAPPFKLMEDIVGSLIGYEIIQQDRNSCIIADIMGDRQEDVASIINKLFQSINLLVEIVFENPADGNLPNLRKNIFKLRDYAQRRIALEARESSYELYALVIFLEKIGGEYFHAAGSAGPSHKDELRETYALLREAHACYLKGDFARSNRLYIKLHACTRLECVPADRSCGRILHYLFAVASRLQVVSLRPA